MRFSVTPPVRHLLAFKLLLGGKGVDVGVSDEVLVLVLVSLSVSVSEIV